MTEWSFVYISELFQSYDVLSTPDKKYQDHFFFSIPAADHDRMAVVMRIYCKTLICGVRCLSILGLILFGAQASSQSCKWTSPGQATVSWDPEIPLATAPHYPFQFTWVVNLVDTIESHFVVTGVSNEDLPDGGPAAQESCPQWPLLYSDTAANTWTDSWSGTQLVQPGQMWQVLGVFDDRGGTGWITHVASDTKYVRTLDMYVFERAFFDLIDPGEGWGPM